MRPSPLIFIVDDDPVCLNSVGTLLRSFEYDVRTFSSAEEFLEADVDLVHGCLLCDIRMPGMSGLELLKTLRLKGITLPVILISGYTDSETVGAAEEHGAIAVLDKPTRPRALVECIQAAFQESKHTC